MKTKQQAKIWQKKVDYFEDGEVKEVLLGVQDGWKVVDWLKVWAVCKDNLALHLSLADKRSSDLFYEDGFSISHIPSGLVAVNYLKKDVQVLNKFNFVALAERADRAWFDYYTDELKEKLNLNSKPV